MKLYTIKQIADKIGVEPIKVNSILFSQPYPIISCDDYVAGKPVYSARKIELIKKRMQMIKIKSVAREIREAR